MHDLFDSRKKLRIKEIREAFAPFGMPDAKEEILREEAERGKTNHDYTSSDKPGDNEQNSDKSANDNKQNTKQKNDPIVDDELDVYDDDGSDNFETPKENPCEAKLKPSKPAAHQQKTEKADPAKKEALNKLHRIAPQRHVHKTNSGKPIVIDIAENQSSAAPFDAINIEDIEFGAHNNIDTIALKNSKYTVTMTGKKEAFIEMLLDRKMLINSLIQQSGVSHTEPAPTDEHHTLKVIASILLDFVPGLSNAKMGSEAIRGVDLVTGEPLAIWQRLLCAAGATTPLLVEGGKLIYQGLKGASEFNKGAKVGEAINEATKIEKLSKTAENAAFTKLSKSNIKHISKHMPREFANEASYLSAEQLLSKLDKRTFFNPKWTNEQVIKASEEAYNALKSKGLTGLQTYKINGEIINVFIKSDGSFDSAYGLHKLTVDFFKK